MDNKLMGKIEAVLFASGDPFEISKLSQVLKADKGSIDQAIEGLHKKYAKNNSGIKMLELAGSLQLSNKEEYGDYIKEALLVKKNAPLSSAAMEILSIIAYNQPEPVTKSFIEQIRGVDSSQTVNSLVEKGLIEEAGRHNLPGRPIVYRTTDIFLRNFGLSSLDDLPPLPSGDPEIEFEQLEIKENVNNENVDTVDKEESNDTQNVIREEL